MAWEIYPWTLWSICRKSHRLIRDDEERKKVVCPSCKKEWDNIFNLTCKSCGGHGKVVMRQGN